MALCAAGSLRAELGRGPREDGDARAQHTRGPELEVDDLHDVQRVYAGGELVAAAQALDDGHSVLRYALADLGDGRVDLLLCKRRATRQLRRQRHEALHDHEHHHLPARFCIRRQAVESRPKSVRSPCAVCLRSHTYAELASSLPLRGHADVDARTLRTWEPWARLVCADVVVGRVPHDSPLQSPMRGTPTCEGQELAAGAEAAAAAFCSSAAAGIHLGQLQVWHQHRQELGGLRRRCHFCVCDGRFAGALHERHHRLHELAWAVCHGYLLWAWALVDLGIRYSLGHSPPRE
mmetsp:Transcript_81080/g.262575  ORF Transcript_81080/g.262575 Transcript_81080/m.262575 type:complete len:292 (+) Transcript_81080:2180-3055(+)